MSEGNLRQSPGQTNIEWEISNFWNRLLNHTSNKSGSFRAGYLLHSPRFPLSGANWFLKMYPNGQDVNDSVGWISLYLEKSGSPTAQRITYRIGIRNHDGSELIAFQTKNTFGKECCKHGWDKFIKTLELLKFEDVASSDGSLTVFCTARVVYTKDVPSLYGLVTLSENLKNLYFGRCDTDITILVQGKKFLAHRNILSARSKVFASMFEHDTMEKASGTVDIPDCDPESFEEFLIFIYSGRGDVVSSKNALSLYETADKYDLKDLRTECADCLSREISVDSLCDIVRLAVMHSEPDLLEGATNFFINNAEKIMKTSKWQTFLDERPDMGNELFLKFLQSLQKGSK